MYLSKTLKKRKHKSSPYTAFITFCGFYLSLAIIAIGDMAMARKEESGGGFFSSLIISLLIVNVSAFFVDSKFRKLLSGKFGIIYFTFLISYSLFGLLQGNQYIYLRVDIGVWAWLIGGLALFRLMIKLPNPSLHLLVFIGIATWVMHYAQAFVLENTNAKLRLLGRVISENNIVFHYSALLLIPTAIALGILMKKNVIFAGILCFLIGLHIYNGIILSGTRSLALSVGTVILISTIGLSYQIENYILSIKKSIYSRAISITTISGVIVIILILLGKAFSAYSVISERTLKGETTDYLRALELIDALSQMNPLQWIIGGGLGYAFDTVLGYKIHALHIGIFTFFLKGGIILFLIVAGFLYIRLPLMFLTAWLRPLSMDQKTRTAILIILPGLFGWISLLSISGGYSQYNFMGVGFGLGAFLHIKEEGLRRFLK